MKLHELDSFKISDAVKFNSELNPVLFSDDHLKSNIRKRLLEISQDFMEHMGVSDLNIKDIVITGSNAAYTYTKHSDIDLHIIVDIEKLNNDDVYRELFTAKKTVYNDSHDIKIKGYDVELYVEDSRQPAKSLGMYSVLNDKWVKLPSKRRANFDENSTRKKFMKLVQISNSVLNDNDIKRVENLLDTIKKYRQAGLDKGGEFSPENLSFKALRSQGIIDKLYKHRGELHSKQLSIDEQLNEPVVEVEDSLVEKLSKELKQFQTDEDYDPNGPPPGPEFKPTMPAGTVRVDVSDVYDWYKLGQHISNLKNLGKHDFGKGPPSTILSFGSEPEEHKYIKDLEKTGLTTTDIDPIDKNQPKGMKRQKVDPTFNVNEDSKISSLKDKQITEAKVKPIIAYHGTRHELTKFAPFTHFGSPQAAKDRLDHTLYGAEEGAEEKDIIYKVKLNMTNPMTLFRDYDKNHDLTVYKGLISDADHMTPDEYKNINSLDELKNFILSKGYDGLTYINHYEGVGTQSYVILDPSQVTIEKVYRYPDTYKVKESAIEEGASGYIPSEKEKNDPRFKTALSVDVKPDTIQKNAKAMGFKVSRSGIPPLLRDKK